MADEPTVDRIKIVVSADTGDTSKKLKDVSSALDDLNGTRTVGAKTDVEEVGQAAKETSNKVSGLSSNMKKFAHGTESAFKPVSRTTKMMNKATLALVKGFGKLPSVVFKPLRSAFSKFGDAVSNVFRMFKRRLMYRVMNAVISGISNGFKEGTQNAYQFSKAIGGDLAKSLDSISTSALYFKNSLGAMVSPLINAFAPIFDTLIDKAVDFLNVINRTIATLTGASTWMRALKYPKEFAEAADDASASAKKLKNTILSIDEINPLNDNSNNKSGSGFTSDDYKKMFEIVPLDDNKQDFSGFFKTLKSSWDKYGKPVFGSLQSLGGKVWELFGAIGESFSNVWKDGGFKPVLGGISDMLVNINGLIGSIIGSFTKAWQEGGKGDAILTNISGIVGDIFTIIGDIAGGFRDAWNKAGAGDTIMNGLLTIIRDISGFVKNILDAVVNIVEQIDWTPLVESVGKLVDGAKSLVSSIFGDERFNKGIKWAIENVLGPFLSTIVEWQLPSIFNDIGDALKYVSGWFDVLIGVITLNPEKMKSGWETMLEAFKHLIADLFNILITPVNGLIKVLNKIPGINIPLLDFNEIFFGAGSFEVPVDVWSSYGSGQRGLGGNPKNNNLIITRASGGMVDQGTAFIAGEAGPEIVANIGNHSGVMNVEQLSAGVAEGVVLANSAQNQLLREQNELLRGILAKDMNINAVVSTSEIVAGLERMNRRNGRTIVPLGV